MVQVNLTIFWIFLIFLDTKVLDVGTVFSLLALYTNLLHPIKVFFLALNNRASSLVASDRIDKLLNIQSVEELNYILDETVSTRLEIKNSSYSWKKLEKKDLTDKSELTLDNISVRIENKEFLAIVGQVGCGKSSLLLAMMKELNQVEGTSSLNGSVAYIP